MKLFGWIIVLLLAIPAALLVAVALGPVVLGILCAVGFGLIVAMIAYGLGLTARAVESAGSRFGRRTRS